MSTNPLFRNKVTVSGNQQAAKSIIFVNGLGYDQSFWNQVTPAFTNDYRLVLFDHVGSIATNQEYFRQNQLRYINVNGYADDLLEICTTLKLPGNTIVVGHSLGAMAGLLASVQSPSSFGKLIMIGASPRYADTEGYRGGFSSKDIDAIYTELQSNYSEWSKRLASISMATPLESGLTTRFAESLARIPEKLMLTVLCSVLQTDQRAKLASVSLPTLVIQSSDDYFVPLEVAEYLRALIPDCQLKVIKALGHLPHVNAPTEVIAAISAFIGK